MQKNQTFKKKSGQTQTNQDSNDAQNAVKYGTQLVLSRLREEDKSIGHLTDHHVKWLCMLAYHMFDTRSAYMAFNFNNNPKQIFITPYKNSENGRLFDQQEWDEREEELRGKVDLDQLPQMIDIPQFKIYFEREPVEADYRIDPNEREQSEEQPATGEEG